MSDDGPQVQVGDLIRIDLGDGSPVQHVIVSDVRNSEAGVEIETIPDPE